MTKVHSCSRIHSFNSTYYPQLSPQQNNKLPTFTSRAPLLLMRSHRVPCQSISSSTTRHIRETSMTMERTASRKWVSKTSWWSRSWAVIKDQKCPSLTPSKWWAARSKPAKAYRRSRKGTRPSPAAFFSSGQSSESWRQTMIFALRSHSSSSRSGYLSAANLPKWPARRRFQTPPRQLHIRQLVAGSVLCGKAINCWAPRWRGRLQRRRPLDSNFLGAHQSSAVTCCSAVEEEWATKGIVTNWRK